MIRLRTLALLSFMYVAAGALVFVSAGQCFAQADPQHMPPVSLPLTGNEIIPCDQNNGYKKCTTQELINAAVAAAVTAIVGNPAIPNAIVANSGSATAPSFTFATAPAVGDYIIGATTDGGYGHTPAANWNVDSVITACASAPESVLWWHVVQIGDGTTFTPSATVQGGVWSGVMIDVTSTAASYAALKQSISNQCTSGASSTVTGSGTQNTLVLAAGLVSVPTSGTIATGPTMTGVTGDLQTHVTNGGGGSSEGAVAAYGNIVAAGTSTVTATPSATGTNISQTQAIEWFLNPK